MLVNETCGGSSQKWHSKLNNIADNLYNNSDKYANDFASSNATRRAKSYLSVPTPANTIVAPTMWAIEAVDCHTNDSVTKGFAKGVALKTANDAKTTAAIGKVVDSTIKSVSKSIKSNPNLTNECVKYMGNPIF
ncbi:hypothetical protein [Vallitalea guaymasensis]|uniref:hypothetical protein n=1 Tax=Vallitalea guaymasensis TaxID=1185412 RepID=UPI0023528EC0|nr:hypothetical protein [Vallitalea guaymasensis]